MKSTSFYAAYLVKKLWTLAAILLVVVALLISILRFSLPYMDGQKARVESWLSSQYGVKLNIGELSADWNKSGPSLVLKDVYLKQDEQSPIGLEITETQIEIDFWGSVLARQVRSKRFDLNGMALSVNLARIQTSESEFPIVKALESLFLEQLHRFDISNSVVDINTRYDQQLIQIQQLSWVNKDQHHQGVGQLRVVELANNSATFVLDLYGNKDDLSGNFYAKGEEIDLSPWLNQLIRTQNQLTQSRANFTFWAKLDKSQVESVQIQLAKSEFTWTTPDAQVDASIVAGDVRAIPDENGWTINIEDLTLESGQQSLVSSWAGHIGRDGNSRFNNINPVNMQAVLPILPLAFDKTTIDFITKLSPQVRLDRFAMVIGQDMLAEVAFSKVSWNQVDDIPGLTDLNGQFTLVNDTARLQINGQDSELKIDNILDSNIGYQTLQLDSFIQWNERGTSFFVPQLRFNSDSVNITQQLNFDTQSNQLSLKAQIDPLSLANVKKLFPKQHMGVTTKSYLDRSLLKGELESAHIFWQGELQQFPFEQQQGGFQAQVKLRDSTLKFDPGWPALTDLDIDLMFENAGLSMQAKQGKLQDVILKQLSASIANLGNAPVLQINAQAQAQGSQVSTLMVASNLADSLGVALTEGVVIAGPLQVNLDLNIPLTGDDVVAKGKVKLNGNSLFVPSLAITFEDMLGEVAFINDKVTFSAMQAQLFEQPVKLDFRGGIDNKKAYAVNIDMQGDWQLSPLLETFRPSMAEYAKGRANWHAKTYVAINADSYNYNFILKSDLVGVESVLPAPFSKLAEQPLPFIIKGNGEDQASNFALTLGNDISFEGVLPHDSMQFSRAHLAIGDDKTVSMGLGFSIFANVKEVDLDSWMQAISKLHDGLPSTDKPILSEPQRIYVNADVMRISGQSINQLELVVKHSTDDWLLDFNAQQIRAKVTLYDDWLNRGIDIKADFIDLLEWQTDDSAQSQPIALKELPPINFECKSCQILGKNLGRVDFSLSRAPHGMQIDSLRVNNDQGILYASGDWVMNGNGSSTFLKGELNSTDFGGMLKGLGLDSGIKDSKAQFTFDLNWQDAPHKFSLDSLNGAIDWRLTDGYLSDVSDKGSRIFSFLSLQSLVRKLSLDFRDVFAKGFFYDKMYGSFQVVDGQADTRDTVIDGAAGEMLIVGYTNLTSKELNYQIEFTPNVTSSLPLLVYWMVNPATAIAALAIDQVLTEAKVISNVKYSVTGTLDEPIMTELDRKSKEVALPARHMPKSNDEQGPMPPLLQDERLNIEIKENNG
ncbi:YhdP family protein [Aliiglaciecola sp. LCG003]|uniref:YhdP family protein n=1 Tax=Aliiglaciecola sp. LCG003 TaxID=3053655 RepID=UPI002572FBE9|nr:YhdP family protein [Aliiglaciecola sp. LCG003]WJG09721.1 YhdP family protein [Aliiglaciecola sp. LCG003]